MHYMADDLAQLEQGVGWASVGHVDDYLAKVAEFEQLFPEAREGVIASEQAPEA